ncbi:hypothetical protein [Pedobacter sp. UBA4863]|uniref:hypothetical protein n=1 Tax=Pedobacter sp. UBA4863 TaxID=1947060 RepID=UPI0025D2B282|nr:hypothetical protein [Pedobacter sp. UBA4863]
MNGILEALDEFVSEMNEKGYDRMFHVNAEYTGGLKESMLAYMEQVVLGREKALDKGITLYTYLRWDGTDKDHIDAWMPVELKNGSFHVPKMSITLGNRYGRIRSVELELKDKPVPAKAAVIAAIVPSGQQVKKKKGFKL